MVNNKRTGKIVRSMFSFLFIFSFVISMNATEYKLWRTKTDGNIVVLTVDAKIIQVQHSTDVKSYSIWRNNSRYLTISRSKYTPTNGVMGVLPPGRYVLKITGSSAAIFLNTDYKPFNVVLWGRQNKLVMPLWDGNVIAVTKPTVIADATYDGTDGMGVFPVDVNQAILRFLSPHNIINPGPKVIGGTGGKTLVGQILPVGIYTLTPGRGQADGIVNGNVVLEIK